VKIGDNQFSLEYIVKITPNYFN